jgi:hypothetical protein
LGESRQPHPSRIIGRTLRPGRQAAVSYRFLDGRPDVRGIEEAPTLFLPCDLSLPAAKRGKRERVAMASRASGQSSSSSRINMSANAWRQEARGARKQGGSVDMRERVPRMSSCSSVKLLPSRETTPQTRRQGHRAPYQPLHARGDRCSHERITETSARLAEVLASPSRSLVPFST